MTVVDILIAIIIALGILAAFAAGIAYHLAIELDKRVENDSYKIDSASDVCKDEGWNPFD